MGQQAARRTYVDTVARRQNLTDAVVSTLADSYLYAMSHSTYTALVKLLQLRRNWNNLSFLLNFRSEDGRRLSSLSGDPCKTLFPFQQLSLIVQHFNSVLIVDYFCSTDKDPDPDL